MLRHLLALLLAFAVFAYALAQKQSPPPQPDLVPDSRVQLPNGKYQSDEILKLDHKKNLEDAAAMVKLAEEVSEDLEKDGRFVMPLKTVKKLEDIEKLSKAIRGRLKK